MNKDLHIVEFRWWDALIVRILLVVVSVLFMYLWYALRGIVETDNQWRLYPFLVIGSICLAFTLPSFLPLRSVPRLICFRDQDIRIVGPFGRERIFSYADISRVFIRRDVTWPQLFKRRPYLFGAVLYFRNDTVKVMFNYRGMPDFSELLDNLRTRVVKIES
jgi:hypothetical protein